MLQVVARFINVTWLSVEYDIVIPMKDLLLNMLSFRLHSSRAKGSWGQLSWPLHLYLLGPGRDKKRHWQKETKREQGEWGQSYHAEWRLCDKGASEIFWWFQTMEGATKRKRKKHKIRKEPWSEDVAGDSLRHSLPTLSTNEDDSAMGYDANL